MAKLMIKPFNRPGPISQEDENDPGIIRLKQSPVSGANFIELLSREFCLANIFAKHFKTDYQPKYINFTCKFGW